MFGMDLERTNARSCGLRDGSRAREGALVAPVRAKVGRMSTPNSTDMSDAAESSAPTGAEPAVGGRRRLARSTLIFSVATGLSRILGLVREMVAAYYFGISGKINAFTVAFQIPNLVRALLADAALSG